MELVHGLLVGVLLVCSVIMTFFILLQEGKGGGLSALQGTKGGNIEGVSNPVRRATVFIAAIWMLSAIFLGMLARGKSGETTDALFQNRPTTPAGVEVRPDVPPANGAPALGNAPANTTTPNNQTPAVELKPGDAPKTDAPKTDVKPADAPKADAPKAETPAVKPEVEAPKVETKPAEAPKAEAPKTEAPKAEEKKDAPAAAPAPASATK